MVSPSALQYDTYYHIYNRGVNRGKIFIEERNYGYFLSLYKKHIKPVADTFAYCLLPNHFHFLVRIKSEDEIDETLRVFETLRVSTPSGQFSKLFNAYAKAINKAYGRTGSLFQNPFGRVPIIKSDQFYRVVIYIHLNPQTHKMNNDFKKWHYSSYNELLSTEAAFLQRAEVKEWFGTRTEFSRLHSGSNAVQENYWDDGKHAN